MGIYLKKEQCLRVYKKKIVLKSLSKNFQICFCWKTQMDKLLKINWVCFCFVVKLFCWRINIVDSSYHKFWTFVLKMFYTNILWILKTELWAPYYNYKQHITCFTICKLWDNIWTEMYDFGVTINCLKLIHCSLNSNIHADWISFA